MKDALEQRADLLEEDGPLYAGAMIFVNGANVMQTSGKFQREQRNSK
jgi:hypothetical protein